MSSRFSRLVPAAAILFYAAIAFEVIIMITPFTVYFYSLYAPILNWLEARPATAWLTAFFLPHITYSGNWFLVGLAFLAPVLFALGLGIFFVCAWRVYSAKLLRRGVVSRGPYARIRHPQYLSLGIAGLGLLLYWPRFFILIAYVTMLFVYYLLARHEEGRMLQKYGQEYAQYMARTPMFLPREPGRILFRRLMGWVPSRGVALAALYVLLLAGSVGATFGLRAYSLGQTRVVITQDVVGVGASPISGTHASALVDASLRNEEVQALLRKTHTQPGHTLVAYIFPQEYMMQHLIADLGEHQAHHGEGGQGGLWPVVRHLGEMFALKPLRQLRDGARSSAKRIIFTEALTSNGQPVPIARGLAPDVLRYPLFFVDIDTARGSIGMVMETPRRHAWGTVPVPAF